MLLRLLFKRDNHDLLSLVVTLTLYLSPKSSTSFNFLLLQPCTNLAITSILLVGGLLFVLKRRACYIIKHVLARDRAVGRPKQILVYHVALLLHDCLCIWMLRGVRMRLRALIPQSVYFVLQVLFRLLWVSNLLVTIFISDLPRSSLCLVTTVRIVMQVMLDELISVEIGTITGACHATFCLLLGLYVLLSDKWGQYVRLALWWVTFVMFRKHSGDVGFLA